MLGSFRKFSSSIYAKILLGIIVIPFVFWGMGSSFKGGSKNVIVKIDEDKYLLEEFGNFLQRFSYVDASQIDDLLSVFIGEKLIEKEVERFQIKLSDESLAKLIKHQKDFKKNNKFSRIKYEKFLLKQNITAINFENNLSKYEKKKHLLEIISGGIVPSKFSINSTYDSFNQKRYVEIIDLNEIFKKQLNFTEDQIKSFYIDNKNEYIEIYKTVKFIELSPKKLVGSSEFTDLFFQRIDEIDDMIVVGEDLNNITEKFNLGKKNTFTLNKLGTNPKGEMIEEIPKYLVKNIFKFESEENTRLVDDENKYFVVEIIDTKGIQKNIENKSVRKNIISNLQNINKRKLISEIISKINQNNFNRDDFEKFSKDKNVPIKKITIKNQDDNEILKKELLSQIYRIVAKKPIVINDLTLKENYLVYVKKIENAVISKDDKEYEKYIKLSKKRITNQLFNAYDIFLKKKYKININYQTLKIVKNNFN